ncbi:MAG: CvpA family protein [Alphaproteobacteria bacterium]|nr:CvpA family protein [Alphaproteobacteria bacterium]
MIGPLTYLDAALIALAILSGLLAMYRGLTREILSILSWIVAAVAVAYFVLYQKPVAQDIAQQVGAPVQIAQVAVGALIFVIVLVVVHLITSKISDTILDSNIGMIDRILGLAFGIARGFILIVIPFMLYENFFPDPKQQLPWVRDAVTLPYIKDTGQSLRSLLVRYIPENLMNPEAGEQQGFIPHFRPHFRPQFRPQFRDGRIVVVTHTMYHIRVTHRPGRKA